MPKKTVLVTGIGGNVGQGILRNIKDSFPEIHLVGVDISEFSPGNYLCDKTYQVPFSNNKNYIPRIQEICNTEKVDLIIPSTDYEVYFLSKNQDSISASVIASDYKTTEKYLDKYKSYLYHEENGIPFSKSWLPSNYIPIEGDIIAKPREGRGSRGILINPSSLDGMADDYLIQPLLKGKEITCAVYVTKRNELHGLFTMERELTNGTTSKSKVVFEHDEKLRDIALKMISLKGLRGAFNIQSIVTKDNNIIPFEINCRISGTNSIRHNLGFQDVKYTIEEHLFNLEPTMPKPIPGIATRILLDVIYPGATDESKLNNVENKHLVY